MNSPMRLNEEENGVRILTEDIVNQEYITTPYKKKKRKRKPKKADHPHVWEECVYGLSFAGNFELSVGTYCPICGKVGMPTYYTKWKDHFKTDRGACYSERSKEALKEFDPKTRTLPYFDIDLFVTKFVDLEGKKNDQEQGT